MRAPQNFHKGEKVYKQLPPSYAIAPEEHAVDSRRSKHLPKLIGPFCVTNVRDNFVTIKQNGVRNSVPIDRIMPV